MELWVLTYMLYYLVKEHKLQGSHGKDLIIIRNFEMNVKDKQECLLFVHIKILLGTVFIFNHCGNFGMFCLPTKSIICIS